MAENTHFSRVSSKGQITLTKPVRESLNLSKGDFVIIEIRDNELVLKKAVIKAESES